MMSPDFPRLMKYLVLAGVSLAIITGILFVDPIAQDLSYHQFADQQTILGIPNFWNVVSNIPFVVVGLIGLVAILSKPVKAPEFDVAYITFFIGVIITGFGSAYYHWNPNNVTLVWDRLPMTLSFMPFFAIMIGKHLSLPLAKQSLIPLIMIGALSVWYWNKTESAGAGDLRPYLLVQFLPIVLIPLMLWFFPKSNQRLIIYVLVAYFIAKLFEHFDHQIYEVLGIMSGHAIKHVIAALGAYYFYLYMRAD